MRAFPGTLVSVLIRDRYEPIEIAGRGGQGEVVRARDQQHDRVVALKVRTIAPGEDREQILSEARVLLGLQPHANLPLVREDFFEDDRYYMVVDWVEGTNLETLVETRGDPGLPASTVISYLAQVADALDHLHAHTPPIVHQDVKPANLILNADGKVILVDFGVAGALDATISAGTRGFMAPEIGAGERATPAADIYSLAATAFCLLTGAPPEGARPEWEGVAAEGVGAIERALRRALASDPARRPGSARDLIEQLRAWLGADLPSGVVTFVLSDVVDSAQRWEDDAEATARSVAKYEAAASEAIETNGGRLLGARGDNDALGGVFTDATHALAAALQIARRTETILPVRTGVHTGEATARAGKYAGSSINRAARIRALAAGGQILCSQATMSVAALPADASSTPLGAVRLADLGQPEHVFQLSHPALPSEFPPLRSVDALPNNLPVQATSFVGRARELDDGRRALSGARLLTLTGLGGSGKTRLALQIAADALGDFEDGVWLAELAAIAEPELATAAVARALGLREEPGRASSETIAEWCVQKRALIVLDTCEHVLGACGEIATAILRSSRDVKILATSSEPIGVAGETMMTVPALPSDDATELFVERARQAKPAFEVSEAVTQICRRLDGIPLAIELAAARVRAMSVEDLAARLDDRFRLLTGGSKTAVAHQQTMRAAMDWSYEPLSEQQKVVFARLSAFSGGFTLDAAEQVCAGDGIDEFDVLDLVTQLVDKSLVVVDEQRYRMLQTVHHYAREKLAASGDTEVRARHFAHFRAFAEAAQLTGPAQAQWLGRLEADHDNLRAAFEWASGEDALGFACALTLFRRYRGYLREGRATIERALAGAPGAPGVLRARALNDVGAFALQQGDLAQAETYFRESLAIALGDDAATSVAMNNLGTTRAYLGDVAGARDLYEECLALRRKLGEKRAIVEVLNNLGAFAPDPHTERKYYEEALATIGADADAKMRADLLNNIGVASMAVGDPGGARASLDEALHIRRELGDVVGVANSLSNLGEALMLEGDPGAAEMFEESLALSEEVGDRNAVAYVLEKIGGLLFAAGKFDRAREVLERGLAIASEIQNKLQLIQTLRTVAACAPSQDEARARLERALALAEEMGATDEEDAIRGALSRFP